MRKTLSAIVLFLACAAYAQGAAVPPNLQPIPEPPPLPPSAGPDSALEPQVTILKRGIDTIEEYRLGGRLYMIKVIPPTGAPYYLVDHRGDGQFTRQDSFDSGIRVPMWVIHSF